MSSTRVLNDEGPVGGQPRPWWVYLLVCADGTLYCGISVDIHQRLKEHNGEAKNGAKYTRTRRPCTLMWAMEVGRLTDAMRWERRIKRMTRKEKLEIIDAGVHLISEDGNVYVPVHEPAPSALVSA